ncbi:MAG: FecR domain-containing protein [Acidobacteriota bacterium]
MKGKTPGRAATEGGSPTDEKWVRDLMVGAGERPELPQGDLETIRQAARAQWLELVERRNSTVGSRRNRLWALAASVLLVVAVAWWWSTTTAHLDSDGSPVVATIERLDGQGIEGFTAGTEIRLGDTLETRTGDDGGAQRMALQLAGGASLRLDALSVVVFSDEQEVELRKGALYFDTGADPAAVAPWTVVTELGAVRHVGTQFEVRLLDYDEAVRIRVREGEVSLESSSGSYSIVAGEQIEVSEDGRTDSDSIPNYGSDWDWVGEITPGIEIDDLPILDYLQWLSRESGRRVVFENDVVERYALEHTISMSIEGMTPMESLDNVRVASDLIFEEQNGSILVLAPETSG